MDYATWLTHAESALAQSGDTTARLDAFVLLAHTTRTQKATILAHPERLLNAQQEAMLEHILQRRLHSEPIAYIIGSKEFYGRDFIVTPDVLVPRPETEAIIDLLKSFPAPQTVIDVGTGCGILAITARLELPDIHAIGTDIDTRCIAVAKQNAAQLHAAVTFQQTDLLADIRTTSTTVVLANLPYVPQDYPINAAATYEPPTALFSEDNGLAHYQRLFAQLANSPIDVQAVICESLTSQHDALRTIAKSRGFKCIETRGLQQCFVPNF